MGLRGGERNLNRMSIVHYSASDLKNMKGQALKDHYHSLIGKPSGLKNTTGLKCSAEIIEAVLRLYGEGAKPSQTTAEEMPKEERKKPGRKPKVTVSPVVQPSATVKPQTPTETLAIESTELPLRNVEVVTIPVTPLQLRETLYFLDSKTNKVYASTVDRRPGQYMGHWNEETRCVEEVYE